MVYNLKIISTKIEIRSIIKTAQTYLISQINIKNKQTFQSCFKPIQWTNVFKGKFINAKPITYVCVKTCRTPDRHLKLLDKSI